MTKFAFSTLGCSGLPIVEVAELAARQGFSGVELRATEEDPVHVGLDRAQRLAAARALRARGISALSIASYVKIAADVSGDEQIVLPAVDLGRLAADLGAPFLRVFPGAAVRGDASGSDAGAGPEAREQEAAATRRLRAICAALAPAGVTVAIETHDSHPRGADVARIVADVDRAQVIWDVLHTYRAGESAAETVSRLRDRMAYVQIKDVKSVDDLIPVAPGEGVLPLHDVTEAIRCEFRSPWVSWEYEHRWFPDQPPLSTLAGGVRAWMSAHFEAKS